MIEIENFNLELFPLQLTKASWSKHSVSIIYYSAIYEKVEMFILVCKSVCLCCQLPELIQRVVIFFLGSGPAVGLPPR